jgi:hypothetical protein
MSAASPAMTFAAGDAPAPHSAGGSTMSIARRLTQ